MLITISQTTPTPPIQTDGDIELRCWYTQNFTAGDGVTPVESGDGQSSFYYIAECTLNGAGEVVIPSFIVQATTESNPTANFFGQLYVNGAPDRMIFGGASGWAIPTIYGSTVTYALLALYNRARRMVNAPNTYFTADETIREILLLAGAQNYAGVGILGRTQLDTAPAIANTPIAVGVNSPLVVTPLGVTNVKTYGATGDGVVLTDGSIAIGTNILNSPTANFTSADIGKMVDINQCGAAQNGLNGISYFNNQVGTIVSRNSATQVVVSFNAIRTVSGVQVKYGTNDSVALIAAVAAAGVGGTIHYPPGNYGVTQQITVLSNQSHVGYGVGVSSITQYVGRIDFAGQFNTFFVPTGTHDVIWTGLSIVGTNAVGAALANAGSYSVGIQLAPTSTAASSTIAHLIVDKCEISQLYGLGMHCGADGGEQGAQSPTVVDIKVRDTLFMFNADNSINISCGGGLEVSGCYFTKNGAAIEQGGGGLDFHDNIVFDNRTAVVLGGYSNPVFGYDSHVHHNWILGNGTHVAGSSAAGVAIGDNAVHVLVDHNIIRNNDYEGIRVANSAVNFGMLTRDIRITNNQIISNALTSIGNTGTGIRVVVNGVVIESNDIFDDGQPGYQQTNGIVVYSNRVRLIRNNSHNHVNYDYFFLGLLALLRDDNFASTIAIDATGINSGTADTNGTAVTWKTGTPFNVDAMVAGTAITINAVVYHVASVAAAPSGTVDTVAGAVTRVSGTSFDASWVGQYLTIANKNYLISAVADGDHLTVTTTYGSPGNLTGASFALYGSVGLTLSSTAGVQTGVAWNVPPTFIWPATKSVTALTITSNVIWPTRQVHTLGVGLVKTITVPYGLVAGDSVTIIPSGAFTTDATGNVSKASTAVIGQPMEFTWSGSKWNPSY